MASLPGLRVGLSLDSATFTRETRAVNASVNRMSRGVNQQSALMQRGFLGAAAAARTLSVGIGALVAGVGIAGLVRLAKSSLDVADAMGKTADKVGVTVGQLQELRFAAERTGATQRALDLSLQRFTRRVGEAAVGTGELKKSVEQYDIQLRNADGTMRPVVAILRDYADAVKGATSPQEQLRLAVKAFDSEGAVLVNLLREGADGIDRYAAEAQRLGVITDDQARSAAAANDALTNLSQTIGTSFTSVVAAAAPQIEAFAGFLSEAAISARTFFDEINRAETAGPDAITSLLEDANRELEFLVSERRDIFAMAEAGGMAGARTSEILKPLDDQIASQERLVASFEQSRARLAAFQQTQIAVVETSKPVTAAISDLAEAADETAGAVAELTSQQKRLAEAGAILVKTSALEERFDNQAEAAAKAADATKKAADEQAALQQRQQQQAAATERLIAQPFENALRSVQSTTADTFQNIFDGGVTSFSDLADAVKDIFTRLAAEMATLLIFNPEVVTGASGFFGGAGTTAGGTTASASPSIFDSLFGASQTGGATASGRQGLGGLNTSPTTGSGAGATIGAGAAGIGVGTASGTAVGGDAGYAAIGSVVGTAIGAAIGAYFANPALGAFIGGAVGGLAGGLLGGSGGGPSSTNGSASGGLGSVSVQGSNGGEFEGFLREFDREIQGILNARQERIADQALRSANSINRNFTGFTPDVALSIARQRVRPVAKSLGFDSNAVANAGTSTGILANLQTAIATQKAIEDLTHSVSTFDRQADDLEDVFADLTKSASRFGISIEGLAKAQEDAARDLGKAQDAAIGSLLDPFQALIQPLEAFQTQLEFAGMTSGGQLDTARADFRRITEEALAGSTTALEQLQGAGQLFIATAEQFGASPGGVSARAEVAAAVADALMVAADAEQAAGHGVEEEIIRMKRDVVDTLVELIDLTREEIAAIKTRRL
ncbi:MAG TPA: hypothetical protein VMX74_05415, partial [Pirellulales bacterium]|nr:hypothetical protein [Pirellulales bacterium]